METPFPGMDPYLEQHWGDVHHNLITFAEGMLNERLPHELRARAQERIVVQLPTDEPETQGYLEIIESRSERRLITVIEIISPSNKYAGKGRELYQQKQNDLMEAEVSLVEIDLLRAGTHVLHVPLSRIHPSYQTPYKVCVHRSQNANAEFYPAPLRKRLPVVGVPLRETDADVPLDLKKMIAHVYRNGRYDDIDYTVPPVPPLDEDDARWADELLRAAGKRPTAAGS
jgi:hypothetical protein